MEEPARLTMQITIIASGSGGNATLFSSGGTRILVDAGVGPRILKEAIEGLDNRGDPGAWAPHAIVITHAHADHYGCAASYSKRLRIPVHVTESTARAGVALGDKERVRLYSAREPFAIGALTISPRPLPHDAAQVALVVSDGARRAAVVTDLGEVPPGLVEHLAGCDVLLIESNHDERMLAEGPYPGHLKRRIRSSRGHLSNTQTHGLLTAVRRAGPPGPHTVVLMHLSEPNNIPALALEVACDALGGSLESGARDDPSPGRPMATAAGAWLLAAPPRGPLRIDAAAAPPEPLPPRPGGDRERVAAGLARQLSLFPRP